MLYRSINVAILVLLFWFSYASMQANQRHSEAVAKVQKQQVQSHQLLIKKQQRLDDQQQSFQESFGSFLDTQKSQANEKNKLQSALEVQKKVAGLYKLHGKVLKADVLRAGGQYKQAAALLKNTKKQIWQVGDRYPKHQKALRASMQTIDRLVKAWNEKDASKTAAPIYQALEKVLLDIKGKS